MEFITTLVFDTHKAIKALQEAGANEPLAEAIVATVGEAMGGNVATKADITDVKAELRADLAARQSRTRRVGSPVLPPFMGHGSQHRRPDGHAGEAASLSARVDTSWPVSRHQGSLTQQAPILQV